MAFNPYGQDTGVEDFSAGASTEEERKKRLARMAGLITGQTGVSDLASQAVNERVGQATDKLNQVGAMIQNPEEEMRKRTGLQPVQQQGPVMPPEVAQQRQEMPVQQPQPVQQVQAPVAPEVVQPPVQAQQPQAQETVQPVTPEQVQLPQPGPSVQVAGPTVLPPQQATTAQPTVQQGPSQEELHQQQVIAARNETDPQKRRQAYAALLSNEGVSEGNKALANRFIAEDYLQGKKMADAEQKIAQATPNDLARYMQAKGEDGSYLKAILFQRLGLTELAKQEQEKISPNLKMESATDAEGNKYTVERNAQGQITRAFNSAGKTASQEEVAKLSAAALPTKAHLLPSVHGSPVVNDKGEVGTLMMDPQTQSTYVLVGNQKRSTAGWTTMAQNVSNVYNQAQAGALGKGAGEGFAPTAMKPLPGAQQQVQPGMAQPQAQQPVAQPQVQTAPAAGGATPQQRIEGDIAGLQREIASTPNIAANQGRLQILRQELDKARQQAGATSQQAGVPGAGVAQQKANLEIETARVKEEQKPAAEAKGKETAASIKKQAFADNAYPIVKELGNIIKESTGSGIGASVDTLASQIGASPKGAQAIAKLETFASPLVSMVPRFEGSQSDRDVQMYQKQAGDFANPKLPIATRLAALQGMVKLLQIYDKEGANDWGALQGHQEKTIGGVTYVYDGKGWKPKK